MNKKEQLALLIDLEDFFWKRTTEFIKVNLKELGERSKEIFEIFSISPERKATALYGFSKGIGEVTKMEDIIKPSLLEVVEKFPPDLVDVYMSGYDIVAKIIGTDEGDW